MVCIHRPTAAHFTPRQCLVAPLRIHLGNFRRYVKCVRAPQMPGRADRQQDSRSNRIMERGATLSAPPLKRPQFAARSSKFEQQQREHTPKLDLPPRQSKANFFKQQPLSRQPLSEHAKSALRRRGHRALDWPQAGGARRREHLSESKSSPRSISHTALEPQLGTATRPLAARRARSSTFSDALARYSAYLEAPSGQESTISWRPPPV